MVSYGIRWVVYEAKVVVSIIYRAGESRWVVSVYE